MPMIYVFHIVICIFLVLTILFQDGKAGGFAGPADNAAAKAVFGAKGAGDFLTKVTTYLAIFFMVTSLTLALVDSDKSQSVGDDFVPETQEQTTTIDDGIEGLPTNRGEVAPKTGDVTIKDEDGNTKTVPLGEAIQGFEIVPDDEVPEEIKEAHRLDRERVEALKKQAEQATTEESDKDGDQ
ncbi:MAG: preprotein translocase subunit SecG [Acidobacteria bacterium]|nr:preprotein translocase subunit SecG [Acidobacteriota bacterium]